MRIVMDREEIVAIINEAVSAKMKTQYQWESTQDYRLSGSMEFSEVTPEYIAAKAKAKQESDEYLVKYKAEQEAAAAVEAVKVKSIDGKATKAA